MPTRIIVSIALAAALAGCSCSNEEDQAAKARIFSPEDPPKVLQAAAEPIDANRLAGEATLAERVFAISAQEAAARLGPHEQQAKVAFRWTAAGREVALEEERFVALGDGGDFHARVDNDEKQGMEWIKVDGVSYARSRYAKFRERRRDRGSSEHVVARAYATLADFHGVLRGAMRLRHAGEATVGGRKAVRYEVELGEPRTDERELPELVFPKNGPDEDTALRLHALREGRPTSVSGTLLVDAEKAVPLRAKLRASVSVPSERGESKLELAVDLAVEGVGRPAKIEVPAHVEDAPRSPGVVATLKAYGISRAGAEADAKEAAGGERAPGGP